jgi:hypothetical protein
MRNKVIVVAIALVAVFLLGFLPQHFKASPGNRTAPIP